MSAQNDHFRQSADILPASRLAEECQSIHFRHLHIDQHDIRFLPAYKLKGFDTVGRHAHHFNSMLVPRDIVSQCITRRGSSSTIMRFIQVLPFERSIYEYLLRVNFLARSSGMEIVTVVPSPETL